MAEYGRKKKKVCQLCTNGKIDYKDVEELKKFISADKGKILPRRVTGTCAKHQRYISKEIKKARIMALLPFVK
ncbi:MAG: 30S ribosomal protein S18 [Mollicutes bacterium]|nr:30S ribosomal protein S18 [Mollicutes bacterium]